MQIVVRSGAWRKKGSRSKPEKRPYERGREVGNERRVTEKRGDLGTV